MNVVLAAYYGTLPALREGDLPDVQEALALRRLYDAAQGGTLKLSQVHPDVLRERDADIVVLGGPGAAQQRLEDAEAWLQKWSEGDRLGREVAQRVVRDLYHARWREVAHPGEP